jgi:hypothetical protein
MQLQCGQVVANLLFSAHVAAFDLLEVAPLVPVAAGGLLLALIAAMSFSIASLLLFFRDLIS